MSYHLWKVVHRLDVCKWRDAASGDRPRILNCRSGQRRSDVQVDHALSSIFHCRYMRYDVYYTYNNDEPLPYPFSQAS